MRGRLRAGTPLLAVTLNEPYDPLHRYGFNVGYLEMWSGGDLNEMVHVRYDPDGNIWASFCKRMPPLVLDRSWKRREHAYSKLQGVIGRMRAVTGKGGNSRCWGSFHRIPADSRYPRRAVPSRRRSTGLARQGRDSPRVEERRKKMALTYGTEEYEKAYQEELARRMESEPRPFVYLTPEWVALFEKAIQEDAVYKELARDWEGSVVLHVQKAPQYGLDIDLYIHLDLWHGDCRRARIVPPEVGEAGDFVITGSAERWMEVGRGQLDTVKGMMQGKLKLKGDLPTIVRYVKAAVRLTEISQMVGGRYPDELSPEEIENLRSTVKDLAERFLGITL